MTNNKRNVFVAILAIVCFYLAAELISYAMSHWFVSQHLYEPSVDTAGLFWVEECPEGLDYSSSAVIEGVSYTLFTELYNVRQIEPYKYVACRWDEGQRIRYYCAIDGLDPKEWLMSYIDGDFKSDNKLCKFEIYKALPIEISTEADIPEKIIWLAIDWFDTKTLTSTE